MSSKLVTDVLKSLTEDWLIIHKIVDYLYFGTGEVDWVLQEPQKENLIIPVTLSLRHNATILSTWKFTSNV